MAIFMIYDRNNTHPDPVKDLRGCYKRGYIVQVFEDDTPLVLPPAPPFVFVKVTGITKAQAEKYIQPQTESVVLEKPMTIRRRLYKLRWADLPAGVRNALATNRYYETTWATVKGFIRNQLTGVDE